MSKCSAHRTTVRRGAAQGDSPCQVVGYSFGTLDFAAAGIRGAVVIHAVHDGLWNYDCGSRLTFASGTALTYCTAAGGGTKVFWKDSAGEGHKAVRSNGLRASNR